MRQTFRPADRVRRRSEFLRAYDTGAKQHGRYLTVFARVNDGTTARLGVSATRKIGSAVVRNLAKRRARELFRRGRPDLGVDLVVIPRRDFASAPFAALAADYDSTVRRALGRVRARREHGDAP